MYYCERAVSGLSLIHISKCRQVKAILEELIDKDKDSLRFYYLGDKYKNKVEHIGAKPGFDVTEPLLF